MPDTTRTFLAIALPAPVLAALDRLRRKLEPQAPSLSWSAPSQHHITLAFLGDVDNRDLAAVCRSAEQAAATFTPLDLTLEGLGAFPRPDRARVLWAGVGGSGLEALGRLQADLVTACASAGYRADEKLAFTPHVTLARHRGRGGPGRGRSRGADDPPPDLSGVIARNAGFGAGPFRVAEVTVFSSLLRPEGPEYARLARCRLEAASAESSS